MKWHLSHPVHGTKPWDVQAEAMRRSAGRLKYAYFLEQGLGKTALTLNDFVDSNYDRVLVLAPNSFKMDWALAPEEWGVGDEFEATVYSPRYSIIYNANKRGLLAMNYEAVRAGHGREYALKFMTTAKTALIIDESSSIKNPTSLQTKAALSLVKEAAMVRELNGTPLVQNVMDYWPQLRAVGELNGINPYQFRNRYAVMGGFMGKQIIGMRNEEELYKILNRCSFRALKDDWRDLPPKTYTTVHLEMTTRQRKAYNQMMEEFYVQINGLDVTADLVLTQMNKLRQISSCLAMQDGEHTWLEKPADNPKIRATLDLLHAGRGKGIVFYYYKPSGAELFDALSKAGLQPAEIKGGMKPEQVSAEKARFNNDTNCRVLIGQIEAASRGHTLLGQPGSDRCNKSIYYENSFARLHRAHSEDRNHRGEQDQPCDVFDLITSEMDQITVNILQAKKSMADGVDDVVAAVRKHGHTRKSG